MKKELKELLELTELKKNMMETLVNMNEKGLFANSVWVGNRKNVIDERIRQIADEEELVESHEEGEKMDDEIKLKDMTDFLENVYKDIKKQPTLEEELEKERKFINKIKGDNEDEIKEIKISGNQLQIGNTVYQLDYKVLDYITNLQEENEKLKELCNKYEEEHSTAFKLWTMKMEEMPCYEEFMNYKSRCEKAIEYNIGIIKDTKGFYRPTEDIIYSGDTLIDIAEQNINILQGSDNNE